MEKGRVSRTAIVAAINRAAHLFLDDDPKILCDDLAICLSGMPNEEAIRDFLGKVELEFSRQLGSEIGDGVWPGYRGFVVARNRYAEDELEKAIKHGTTQYVILGAGLDSFAFRRRDLKDALHIFEVDHPASQQWKKERILKCGLSIPHNLTFIPLDLQNQTLSEALRIGGYEADFPSFFSLLGVTQYLSESAVFEILQEVVRGASGTVIVFDYVLIDALLSEESQKIVSIHKKYGAESGEPWLSQYHPVDLKDRVKKIGFVDVSDFGPKEAEATYFSSRLDSLAGQSKSSTFEFAHLMRANN